MVAKLRNLTLRYSLFAALIELFIVIKVVLHQDDTKRGQELQGPSSECDVDTSWRSSRNLARIFNR
jgi:hypothetical protein